MSDDVEDQNRYLGLMRREFGGNVIAYNRGTLRCFGTGELPCPNDIGRGETWRGAALSAVKDRVRVKAEKQIESEAEAKLRTLERATPRTVPRPADDGTRYCSLCHRSDEGGHPSSCNGPDQKWLTRAELSARGGSPR